MHSVHANMHACMHACTHIYIHTLICIHTYAVDESDGCGAKFAVLVVSDKFVGMPLIDRQVCV